MIILFALEEETVELMELAIVIMDGPVPTAKIPIVVHWKIVTEKELAIPDQFVIALTVGLDQFAVNRFVQEIAVFLMEFVYPPVFVIASRDGNLHIAKLPIVLSKMIVTFSVEEAPVQLPVYVNVILDLQDKNVKPLVTLLVFFIPLALPSMIAGAIPDGSSHFATELSIVL